MSEKIEIDKGARYPKIIGSFGEYLVCHWLSRSGFEVGIVDHTGMDVIAHHRPTKQRLGITVKSRTRIRGTEGISTYIFREAKQDREKLLEACEAFGCDPWIAAYVECNEYADLFLTSLENYDDKYRSQGKTTIDAWKMTEKQKHQYAVDRDVRHIRFDFKAKNWWPVAVAVVDLT
jgi:hypothetical protein